MKNVKGANDGKNFPNLRKRIANKFVITALTQLNHILIKARLIKTLKLKSLINGIIIKNASTTLKIYSRLRVRNNNVRVICIKQVKPFLI